MFLQSKKFLFGDCEMETADGDVSLILGGNTCLKLNQVNI